MSLIDVLIIYLACGAPSSVFEVTRTDHRSTLGKLRSVAFAQLFWPVHLFILAGSTISSVRQRTKNERIEKIREKIESEFGAEASSRRIFEFRDSFYRMTSLSDASLATDLGYGHEVYNIAGHPNADLAARCAARKNNSKIRRHLNGSKSEFAGLLGSLGVKRDSPALDDLSGKLGISLPDIPEALSTDARREPATGIPSQASKL